MGSYRFQPDLRIPLRDGIRASGSLYLPSDKEEPTPCILILTPYIADTAHVSGAYFAEHGVACAIVNSRGRGGSEGQFDPLIQEADDGHDIVEWLGSQPFCDGRVAMSGGSYLGFDQWATAGRRPPHLATIVPCCSVFPGIDFPMGKNIFGPYTVQWLMLTHGAPLQQKIFADAGLWSNLFRRWHEEGRALRQLDQFIGLPSEKFQEWLQHPMLDSFWDAYVPSDDDYAAIDIPVLTVTGSYDDDQPGALEHYRRHISHCRPEIAEKHHLVIGPWDHAGCSWGPRSEFGGLKFNPAQELDKPKLYLDWYKWTMLEGPKPSFLQKRVAYFVMGADRWRYADTLEEVTASKLDLFLHSNGEANDVYHSGKLSRDAGKGGSDRYTYDPRVNGPEVEAEAKAPIGQTDQSVALALSGRQLIYTSAPFEEDVEVSGFFQLKAWIAIDCPDTDFYASVYEILPDGSSIRLSTDAIRARYRNGLRVAELVSTDEPLLYHFNSFSFVSRLVRRGSRLRLQIAPLGRLIEAPFTEQNFNSGGVVAEETVEQSRPVTVTLFHGREHQTVLSVPIGRPASADEVQAPAEVFAISDQRLCAN